LKKVKPFRVKPRWALKNYKKQFSMAFKDKRNGGCAPLYKTQNVPEFDGHE
jgi:hypothetical protein